MGRLLLLLFVTFSMVSAMGFFGGDSGYDRPRRPRGDWPDEFPERPNGFVFKCNGQCFCPCACAQQPTTESDSDEEEPTTAAITQAPTEEATPAATHSSPPTTASTSTIRPTTTTTIRTTPTTTTVRTTPTTTTVRPTTQSTSTIRPSSTSTPAPSPVEPEVSESNSASNTDVRFEVNGGPVALDNPEDDGVVTKDPAAGTTFWIRSPTPPEAPVPVQPGSGFSLGTPVFGKPAIDSPFAPDQALDPLNAAIDADLDFNIKTVGTPKAPRAPIDPDA